MKLFKGSNGASNTAEDVPDLKTELTVLDRAQAARQRAERTGDKRLLRDANAVSQTATIRANAARGAGQR